jgi:alkaline phosphatase D
MMRNHDIRRYVEHVEQLRRFGSRTDFGAGGRRRFLKSALALAVASILSPASAFPARNQTRFVGYPFTLGVASGSPLSDGIVLWTRLAPEPLNGGGMVPGPVTVGWELAEDERFEHIAQRGEIVAVPELGHSVHVEVTGLQPARRHWYRFFAGDETSPVGRTRTAPVTADRLRFAFASCQQYEQGYFSAYRHMAEDDIELVIFLGDYIYESSWGRAHVRRHSGPAPKSLVQYRNRHAQYKTDPDLQRIHALLPWIVTWDDHEVENDYADDQSEHLDPQFLMRRAAAYLAYYEHMPLRRASLPVGPNMRLYERYDFGQLVQFHLLDDRQYRSHQACPRPGRGGSNTVENCAERESPQRTMLGAEQEKWLFDGLSASRAKWNIIAQQTIMAQIDNKPGPGQSFWTDAWDGYPVARARLLNHIGREKPSNPIVIGGDAHCNYVCDLRPDFDNPRSPIFATEFRGTSITSQGLAQSQIDAWRPDNPHVLLADASKRGYVVMDIDARECRAQLRVIDNEKVRDSKISTLATYVVMSGSAGAKKI